MPKTDGNPPNEETSKGPNLRKTSDLFPSRSPFSFINNITGVYSTRWGPQDTEENKKILQTRINLRPHLYKLFMENEGLCALSGLPMTGIHGQGRVTTNLSLDRIDPTKGYTEDNVQLVQHCLNCMKAGFQLEEFLDMCERVLRHHGRL